MDKLKLQKAALEVRKGIINAVHSAKAGHPGGSLSAAEIFTYLYFEEMNINPDNPKDPERDRFVLSKGHTAPGLYATLANRGYFPVEDLLTLRKTGSYLQGHPDMKQIPGVDMSSGSLGQGLSCAVGMALAGKLGQKDYRVYALCGDGVLHDDMSRDLITSHELVIVGNDMSCDELWENAKTIDDSCHAFMHFGSEEKKRAAFDDLYERQRVLFTPYII